MSRILWSFMSQRGCYEPALPIIAELVARGHTVVGLTTLPQACPLPWDIEVLSDASIDHRIEVPAPAGPPGSLQEALAGKIVLAARQSAQVARIVKDRHVDVVLADGFRLGAGLGAERVGVPWVSYTHHYFDETSVSEGMVEYYCQRFGRADAVTEIFASWWPTLRRSLDLPPESRPVAEVCWWNLSPLATLVLGLPEFKQHSVSAPSYVHRVGPSIWHPAPMGEPAWLRSLGSERPAILVALSTNPVPDTPLALTAAEAWSESYDVVVTAGHKRLPRLPPHVVAAGNFPHSQLLPRVAVVTCSAGYGTVTRCACLGTLVLAVPQMGDQPLVAAAVAQSGLGLAVSPEELTADQLRAALDDLLASNRARAQQLAASATHYEAPKRSADLVESSCNT